LSKNTATSVFRHVKCGQCMHYENVVVQQPLSASSDNSAACVSIK